MDFVDNKLALLESNSFAEIYSGLANNFYFPKERILEKKEESFASLLEKIILRREAVSELKGIEGLPQGFLSDFRDEIISLIEINRMIERLPSRGAFSELEETFISLIKKVSFIKNKSLFVERVLHNSIGFKKLAFFSLDPELEDLLINSQDSVFVIHKRFGTCKVPLSIDEKSFDLIVKRIAFSVNKLFDINNPLLDARLPDGSRVNATFFEVSPRGSSLTIRKFASVPLTVIDLIEEGTLSSESAAFLWLLVDGMGLFPQNILVTGSTASGKTTLLNVLSNFSRLSERIVSIEDTLELSLLSRNNWVALESKHSTGCEVSMDSLLKNSLRMRPDRLIVGEVRGVEALTLFTALDNGHSGMGTLHSNSAREAVTKLQEKPFSVPASLIPLVDLIVVMQRHYSKETGLHRQVVEIAELSRMENKVLLASLFEFKQKEGLVRTQIPSHLIEELSDKLSISKTELKKEMDARRLVLEWMREKNVRKPLEVLEVIQSYYYNPKKVTEMVYDSMK